MTTPQKNDPTLPKWAQQKNQPASPQPQRAAVQTTRTSGTSVVSGDARAKKNVAAWVLLGVVVLLGVGLIGLASINGDTSHVVVAATVQQNPISSVRGTPTVQPIPAIGTTYKGQGTTNTPPFSLMQDGDVAIRFEPVSINGAYIVRLRDARGSETDVMNGRDMAASEVRQRIKSGIYTLSVQAAGAWSVIVTRR